MGDKQLLTTQKGTNGNLSLDLSKGIWNE